MLKGDVHGPASNLGNDNSGVIADKANIISKKVNAI